VSAPDSGAGHGLARVDARVVGLVQGVGFRYFVRREATGLGLSGWVANLPDGSVRVVAEGERGSLERFMQRLSVGPPGASVRDAAAEWSAAAGSFTGFSVRSGSHPGD
jgi:acylphosphatase